MTTSRSTRRQFCARAVVAGCGAGVCAVVPRLALATGPSADIRLTPASHWKAATGDQILCQLCPRECTVADLERGYCGVRENRDGKYFTLVHSTPCTINADPIEKKPLFHFLPGSTALSLATAGCNMLCKFCQNWEISQARPEQAPRLNLPPEQLVKLARRNKCRSIAFTYTEPVTAFEFVLDTANAKDRGDMAVVIISNGYIRPEPLRELLAGLSAVKIDLKAFTEDFYASYCDGKLAPVLETLLELRKAGIWFEIVTLLLPGLNDSEKEIADLCKWIQQHLGSDVPLHFTRFHPTFQLNTLPPTPVSSLDRAHAIARAAGLNYVYVGNVPGHPLENTRCHRCQALLIARHGYFIKSNRIVNGLCPDCGVTIPGRWGTIPPPAEKPAAITPDGHRSA